MTMKDKILNWFAVGRVGMSSAAMAFYLSGEPCDGSYPIDPDDFNRCLLFLEDVPEARDIFSRMAEVNKVWAALVTHWNEIEALFYSEVGMDRKKSPYAPRTLALIRKVIDSANREEGC
jgi:hypothetical protein